MKNKQGQEEYYFEGAVVDCLNFKDLTEKHTGLETIVVLDVLGSDSLIRQPRNLYDAWVLSMVVPLVETAKDDLRVFAWKYNYGWRRDQGAKANLLRVCFDIPDELQDAVLDWSSSNAETLFDLGHRSAKAFIANNRAMLAFNPPGPPPAPPPGASSSASSSVSAVG